MSGDHLCKECGRDLCEHAPNMALLRKPAERLAGQIWGMSKKRRSNLDLGKMSQMIDAAVNAVIAEVADAKEPR